MDKIKISNTINRMTGGDELLFCTRIYVQSKLWGGFWIPLRYSINLAFRLIRGERDHVRASFIHERRHHAKAKIQNLKGATAEAQEPANDYQANQNGGEKCVTASLS